jgi:hypothetical protein
MWTEERRKAGARGAVQEVRGTDVDHAVLA